MRKTIVTYALCIAMSFMAVPSYAQVALNAQPDDPVYHVIDILIAHDLVRNVIVGQRPYSRLEIARIMRASRNAFATWSKQTNFASQKEYSKFLTKKRYLDRLLAHYEKEYVVELRGMDDGVTVDFLKKMDMALLYNGSKPRTMPRSNGAGLVDGVVTSFDRYDGGLTYPDGALGYIETEHDFQLTKYLLVSVQPRFQFYGCTDGDAGADAQINRLYLKSGWRNFEFQIGRDNLLWGQGEFGGLFASFNPRGLDMIKLSDPYPIMIPYVGAMKFTFFVSNLGPERYREYPYFYGLKWSWRPARYFEFALSHTITMGGKGAPSVTWWEPIAELMPFHKWGNNNIGAGDPANNSWGFFEFRVTIPQLHGTSFYYEAYIEDSIVRAFRLPDNWMNQVAFTVGWYMPRLTDSGDFGLRLEYHHLPPLAYRHGGWESGYTLNQRPIGDPLGPDTDGIYATLYWYPHPTLLGRIEIAYEDYDSSTYYTEANQQGGGDRILKLDSNPHERRFRITGSMDMLNRKGLGLRFDAGYEHINNWDFNVGRSVNNFFLKGMLRIYFDQLRISS